MEDRSDPSTNTTLLARLRQNPSNQSAWDEFVDGYGRLIFQWCRHRGLQEADAEDVTQNVLLVLAKQMREFVYDPSKSFRGWLNTIAHRGWCRFVDDRRRWSSRVTVSDVDQLCSREAQNDFLRRLEAEGEAELVELAKQSVRRRVNPRTWEAFRLSAEEDLSGAEVAALLQIKVGAVFVARSRVQRMIQDEVRRLDGGELV
jgi:RNA polymerase sigma factor (sigma-70 family)